MFFAELQSASHVMDIYTCANIVGANLTLLLQNSASLSSRGRLLYIHPVVGRRRHVLSPLILPP